jgi:hypothetical protein
MRLLVVEFTAIAALALVPAHVIHLLALASSARKMTRWHAIVRRNFWLQPRCSKPTRGAVQSRPGSSRGCRPQPAARLFMPHQHFGTHTSSTPSHSCAGHLLHFSGLCSPKHLRYHCSAVICRYAHLPAVSVPSRRGRADMSWQTLTMTPVKINVRAGNDQPYSGMYRRRKP